MQERSYKPGELIGHYQVLGQLGAGGFCTVYEGHDLSDAEEAGSSAVKVCRFDPKTMSPVERQEHNRQLWREFELIQKLNHQNVVRALECRQHEGLAYYAMELLEGPGLGQFLGGERRPLWMGLDVFQQLTEGLAYCHREGVVHRDLKPSNIIVTGRDEARTEVIQAVAEEQGWYLTEQPEAPLVSELGPGVIRSRFQPVLFDFGTAQSLAGWPATEPGGGRGTAEYLSPESCQALRENRLHPAEPGEDVHALGVILYGLLTGQLPWRTPAARFQELLAEISEGQPRHPRELNPEAPPALSDLAMLCLRKQGTERPADAGELLWRVNAALKDDAPHLRQLAPEYGAATETPVPPGLLPSVPPQVAAPAVAPASTPPRRRSGRVAALRHAERWLARSAFVALLLIAVGEAVRSHEQAASSQRVLELSQQVVDSNSALARTLEHLPALWLVEKGLKMPESPDPRWLRPTSDGECRDPQDGRRLVATVLRGACWSVGAKTNPEKPCPNGWYDAPPEASSDLRNLCFVPYAHEPRPPALTPEPR